MIEFEIHNVQQGSEEWHKLRVGKITASKIGDCFTSKLSISKAGTATLAKNLLAEELKKDELELMTWQMQRGVSLESEAREMLSIVMGEELEQVGFFTRDNLVGCSPDAVVKGKEIGVEIKCPICKTHIDYLIEGEIPYKYYLQVQFGMYVTGWNSWMFCSYYPEMKPVIKTIHRDEEIQGKIADALTGLLLIKESYQKLILI